MKLCMPASTEARVASTDSTWNGPMPAWANPVMSPPEPISSRTAQREGKREPAQTATGVSRNATDCELFGA